MKKHFLCGGVFGVILGLSSLASAQSTKGLWISGSFNAIGIHRSSTQVLGTDVTSTFSSFGLSGSDVGIGYQFGEHFLFGGRMGFAIVNPDNGDSFFSGHVKLHFQIPFLTGKTRPFIMIEPGIVNVGSTGPFSNTQAGFVGNVGGGVHLFLTDSFSISPYGALGYQRLFDVDASLVSFTVGGLLSGWIWR